MQSRSLAYVYAAAMLLSPAVAAQDWKPAKNVDIVVSFGAGGAADRQARVAQRFLQAIPGIPSVTVSNKPGGLTPAQIAFWDQAFRKVVQDEEWKKVTVENVWGDDYKNPAETRKHLDSEYALLQKMLADLGVSGKSAP